ncbi:DUF6415 family natural product biosynthesis protein [Streptomyces sp. 1222.5]|uniref:DUF6415 family natural product biosynthesis protein n=1 Tax=Streptomyces sp. 1222.5 TaxID=1881026 RepID=UPI003D7203D5
MSKPTVQPPTAEQAANYPPDLATMRRNALRLIGPEQPTPWHDELERLNPLLRGHLQLLIPEVEKLAFPLPANDPPRACAIACLGEARMRLRLGWADATPGLRLSIARKLARSLNALCDHYENLTGT